MDTPSACSLCLVDQSDPTRGAIGFSVSVACNDAAHWRAARAVGGHVVVVSPTFFHSAATCLHVPARLTREATKHEGRKPRTSERHVVGCCEVLAGGGLGTRDSVVFSDVSAEVNQDKFR